MPSECKQFLYAELAVGQTAEFDFVITDKLVVEFASLSGDQSPVHTDPAYAAQTEFGKPIAHGMIAGMLFSRLVGMELPGKYCVYLSQSFRFHHPMFPGQTILVRGTLTQKSDAFRTVTIAIKIFDKHSGELLVDGEALVRVLK